MIFIESPIYFVNRTVSFSIPGKPFGKQRPKAARRGGFIQIYTPRETKLYEEHALRSYIETIGKVKLTGPIEAEVRGVFPVPKSSSKKEQQKMLSGEIDHTKKPDCDNMGKVVFDALNSVAFDDDSAICRAYIDKRYGENPRVDVRLKELNRNIDHRKDVCKKCLIFQERNQMSPLIFQERMKQI